MENKNIVSTDVKVTENGKIAFAPDVIATIANLAASEVPGVVSLGGGIADSITGILSKKNFTKGVRVEVGNEEAAVDISINVKYGIKIQPVSVAVQQEVKRAVETMTGLRVVEVNVYVQSVAFDEPEKSEKVDKKKSEPEPRVK